MKKLSKLFNSVLAGSLFCIVLASCENFMTGSNVRKEIEDAIAEANAQKINIIVSADEGTGTTFPLGNYDAKLGYSFQLTFSENPKYSFVKWQAVNPENSDQLITEGVKFEDATQLKTKVTISTKDPIRIMPLCVERIAIQGEPSPNYNPNGVSRDRPILIRFSKPLAPECFIFSQEEIAKLPENAVINKTLEGENEVVYSYSIPQEDGSLITYFKNISITNEYNYSLAGHFSTPVIEGDLLSISADKNNPIVFDENETKKVIKVTLSSTIYGKDNIAPMLNDYSWNYVATPETDEKAIVEFRCNTTFGTNSKTFSIGSKIPVSFIEDDEDSEFVRWIYDSTVLDVDDATKKDAVFLVKEKTSEHGVIVTAETRVIGKINSILPEYKDGGVKRNTPIQIIFNKPMDEATLILGDSILISETFDKEASFEGYFDEPYWNGNTLIIKPLFDIKDLFNSSNDQKNLMITLVAKKIKDAEGNRILETDYSHPYRINYKTETIGPEFTLSVYKPNLDSDYQLIKDDSGNMTYEQLVMKVLDDFDSNPSGKNEYGDASKNHIQDTIYIDYTAYDKDSGFEKLIVQETFIAENVWNIPDEIPDSPDCSNFISASSSESKKPYKLQSFNDGIIKLDFVFSDRAGNSSVKSTYVFKDTKINDNSLKIIEMNQMQVDGISLHYNVNGTDVALPSDTAYKFTDTALDRIELLLPPSENSNNSVNPKNPDEVRQTLTFYFLDVNDSFGIIDWFASSINVKYIVKVGESKNSLTPVEGNLIDDGQKLQFSFTRNIKKDCFIEITVTDFVGNTRTETRIIPAQLSIIGDSYSRNNYWGAGFYDEVNVGRYDNFVSLINSYTDVSYGFYCFLPDSTYTYKIMKLALSDAYLENYLPRFYTTYDYKGIKINQEYFAPDGVYEYYILPFYKYGTQFYYGTISKGNYYYNTAINTCSANLPDSSDDFECVLDNPVPNLGYRTGHITFDDNFHMSENFEYGIRYASTDKPTKYCYSGLDFILPSGKNYNIYIYARSSDGSKSVSSVSKEIDATYDNIAPDMSPITKEQQEYFSTNLHGPDITKLYLKTESNLQEYFPKDNTGLKTSAEGDDYCEFKYCITPYVGDMVYLTNEDFVAREQKGDVFTAKFKRDATYVILDFNDFYYQTNSTLTLKVEDNYNNYLISNLNVKLNSTFNEYVFDYMNIRKAEDYVTEISSGAHVKEGSLWLEASDGYHPIIAFGLKDNKWEFINNSKHNVYASYSDAGKLVYDDAVFISCSLASNILSCSLYSDINYICKEYEEKKVNKQDISNYCKSKSVIPAYGDGYQIFYDAPCFAHTMAFPTDKLDYIQEQIQSHPNVLKHEYQAWDSIGREYGVKVLNADFAPGTATYYAPVDEIPDGYSYVTVVHFADHTAVMTEVKEKP